MSLIDEALRRAQAAQTAGSGAPGLRVPMPLPDPGRSRRRRRRRLAAAALVGAAAIVSGLLLLRRGAREQESRHASIALPAGASEPPVGDVIAASAAATPTLVPIEVAGPAAGISGKPRATATLPPRTAGPAATTGASAPAPTVSVTAVRTVATPAAATSPTPVRAIGQREPPPTPVILPPVEVSNASASHRVVTEEPPPKPTAPPRTFVGTAYVPSGKLELDGIVYNESSPTALINGRVVAPGGFVAGYTVVRIERDRVELKDEDGTIILKLK